MRRRDLLASICGAAGALIVRPVPLGAQQTGKLPRIGYMVTGSRESLVARQGIDAFRHGLAERGYAEGENIVIEYRSADGNIERFPGFAAELVRLGVMVIVAANTPAGLAARQATTMIPIVVSVMGDPVADGLVASLARPGGNITGLTFLGPELVPKRIELLKEALPSATQVAVLWHRGGYGEQTTRDMLREAERAATAVRVQLRFADVRGASEFEGAFSAMAAEHADALMVFPSPMFFNERTRIVELAAKYRLPAISMAKEFVQLGGLISYGASIYDLIRRSATFVDKILKGAKPSDLPVEQPTKFELAINLKTARTLGLTIPQSLIYRADEVIE
jgi:putative tryptophan/tyrosine transport system substrate-binding protein